MLRGGGSWWRRRRAGDEHGCDEGSHVCCCWKSGRSCRLLSRCKKSSHWLDPSRVICRFVCSVCCVCCCLILGDQSDGNDKNALVIHTLSGQTICKAGAVNECSVAEGRMLSLRKVQRVGVVHPVELSPRTIARLSRDHPNMLVAMQLT